jgi:hypothetical protein
LAQDGAAACLLSRIFEKYRQNFIPWRSTDYRARRGRTLARLLFAWNSGIKKASIALKDVELACIEKDEQLLPVYASGRGKNTIQKANAGMTRFRDIARAILASNHRSA